MSKISRYETYTDWDWADDARPELRIHRDLCRRDGLVSCDLMVGGAHRLEIDGGCDPHDLAYLLEGYRDVFAEAAKALRSPAKAD